MEEVHITSATIHHSMITEQQHCQVINIILLQIRPVERQFISIYVQEQIFAEEPWHA